MNDDDFLDIHPWPPIELVGQLVSHVALGRRGLIEGDQNGDVFERETDRFELDAWAKLELTAWMTAEQTAILATPLADLSEAQLDSCQDALVVASTIGWAIYIVALPTLPVSTDGGPEGVVLEWAPGPWTPVRNTVKAIRVRSDELLATERERWELLTWRSTLFQDNESIDIDRQALEETIAELAGQSLVQTNGQDFTVTAGKPFSALQSDDLDQIAHEAELRLKTLNWICGFGESPATAPIFLDD
ncbi:MAG: hypothetical protein M3457_19390 [Chloroflexota bacterium]|nr:hypothetical protein [Chloroflexota bacterium]